MTTLLGQESWPESIEHLELAGDQPVRWSWLALLKDDTWCLWGLTVRVGALQTPGRSLHSKGAYLHSESISAAEAQDRLRHLTTGPGSADVGDIGYELASAAYPAWWIPPGDEYGIGAPSQWPEYRMEWPIKGADVLRSLPVWYGPFRAPGFQYPNFHEAIHIHLYGVRPTARSLSSNIMGNVLIRLPYPYRIGALDVAERSVTVDTEWSGFAPRHGLDLHLSARRSRDQVEPDQMERPVPELGGTVTFDVPYHTAQAELFLNDPGVAVPCDQRQWELNQPPTEAARFILEPEERIVLQQVPVVTLSQDASSFRLLAVSGG